MRTLVALIWTASLAAQQPVRNPRTSPDDEGDLCRVGLEFVNPSPESREGVERFIREWSDKAGS